jgi:hypothetical protein
MVFEGGGARPWLTSGAGGVVGIGGGQEGVDQQQF